VYAERIEALVAAMLVDEGVRLPGQRRFDAVAAARTSGFEVQQSMLDAIHALI
jgi:(2R)-3-sulfolactate dehydrogenase (NADP+)